MLLRIDARKIAENHSKPHTNILRKLAVYDMVTESLQIFQVSACQKVRKAKIITLNLLDKYVVRKVKYSEMFYEAARLPVCFHVQDSILNSQA